MKKLGIVVFVISLTAITKLSFASVLQVWTELNGVDPTSCGLISDNSATNGTSLSSSCTSAIPLNDLYHLEGSASAVASFGKLGVGVSVLAAHKNEFASGGGNNVAAAAYSTLLDYLTFSVQSGYITIPIEISGRAGEFLNYIYSPILNGVPRSSIGIGASYEGTNNPQTIFSRELTYADETGLSIVEYGHLGVTNFTVPIINGEASLFVFMFAQTECPIGYNQILGCTGFIDFMSSARLLAASVFDEFGNKILDPKVNSSSGFNYLEGVSPHVSSVPVPASLPLLACAIGLLTGIRRKHCQGAIRNTTS